MRVGLPWLCVSYGLLLRGIICVKGIALRINELDVIVKLYYR
jgi:hypothetical protein